MADEGWINKAQEERDARVAARSETEESVVPVEEPAEAPVKKSTAKKGKK